MRSTPRHRQPTACRGLCAASVDWTKPPHDRPVLRRFDNPPCQPGEHPAARRRAGIADAACSPEGRGRGRRPFGFPDPSDPAASPNGPDDDGDRLRRALDPNLLLWVHATLVDSALVTYQAFVGRLTAAQREAFYQESKLAGELLGIPHDRFPGSLSAFDGYVDGMIRSGEVHVTPRAKELGRLVVRPPLRLVPGPVLVPFAVVTAGLLPDALRDAYGLKWGRRQQQAFKLAVAAVPRIVALTPPVLRVWPLPGHSVTLEATS